MFRMIILIWFLTSCAHSIHLVQTSDYDPYFSPKQGKLIKARSEQFVIFYFVFDTKYVEQAYEKLQEKCPHGQITGITTQYSTSLGFFSWTNKILMQGRCYQAKG